MKNNKYKKIVTALKIFSGYFFGFTISVITIGMWRYWDKQPNMAKYVGLMELAAGIPITYADYIIYKLIPEKYMLFKLFPLRNLPLLHIILVVFGIISTFLYSMFVK